MKEPVRNLLVYADGRVVECPFRLEGHHYIQTDRHENGREVTRYFRGEYATDASRCVDGDPGTFTMVYLERPDMQGQDMPESGAVTVHGTPVLVDVPEQPRNRDARFVHKDCRSRGGHRQGRQDHCEMCGLSGYVIRTMRYVDERDEKEAKESAALRDKLVKLSDDCMHLKAENSDLRRETERLKRHGCG